METLKNIMAELSICITVATFVYTLVDVAKRYRNK